MEAKTVPSPLSNSIQVHVRPGLNGIRHRIFVAFVLLLLYFLVSCVVMTSKTSSSMNSIFLPYTKGFSSDETPLVKATINGTDFDLPIDTGSTGILLGAPLLPNVSPSDGTPAHAFLSSSRILYSGRLVNFPVTFHGLNGTHAVATVPILVVDISVVCPWYDAGKDTFQCPYNPNAPKPTPRDLSKITYMGVGFGRNGAGDGQPYGVPARNPFINIESINGEPVSLRAGYTISTGGIHLGLTNHNTRGYSFVSLEPGVNHEEDPKDWAMVEMSFRLNDQSEEHGRGLVDTGISQMYIRTGDNADIPIISIPNPNPKGEAAWVRRVQPGTRIAIGFPNLGSENKMRYSFRVGEVGSMEPSFVAPGKPRLPPFVNTGRNFLYGYSIAFDAKAGRFGFRPVKQGPIPSL